MRVHMINSKTYRTYCGNDINKERDVTIPMAKQMCKGDTDNLCYVCLTKLDMLKDV